MNPVSFNQFVKHKDGTYVSLEMDADSRKMLDNFVEMSLGLQERVDPKTYHITVIYSRSPVPSAENYLHMNLSLPVEAYVKGYEVFPTKNQGKCLVMRVECPYAVRLNNELTQQGATSDYPEYKAHITLAYDMKEEVNPEDMPIPQFPLVFDKLNVAPLDPEYTPENKS